MAALLVTVLGSCGGDSSDEAAGVDAGGSVDAAAGDSAENLCPAEPPQHEDSCDDDGTTCLWELCNDGPGLVNASCTGGTWKVSTSECNTTHLCYGSDEIPECSPVELCVVRVGGAIMSACQPDPCSGGLVSAECACTVCGDGSACTVSGLSVTCDSCPRGQLCP